MFTPQPVIRLAEAEGIAVELPSRFLFYPFKDLFIHPLRLFHLPKIAQARADQSMLTLLEVVSSVLSTSDPRFRGKALAYELTEFDFYYVLYWLRKANFTNVSFVHTTYCRHEPHLREVEIGKEDQSTLKISEYVNKSKLTLKQLDKNMEVPYVGPQQGIKVRPRTMGAIADAEEYPEKARGPDFGFRQSVAQRLELDFLRALDFVDLLEPHEVETVLDYEETLGDYGIKEHIKVRCKHCNTERETFTSMNAPSFLPVVDLQQVMDRKNLIAVEYHIFMPDTATVFDLWYLSDAAHAQREAKRKAAEEGLVWHG